MKKMFLLLAMILVLLPVAAQADFQVGDVFAAVASGNVNVYSNAGVFKTTLNTTQGGYTTGMATDKLGNVYVTNFSAGSLSQFDKTGALTNAAFVSPGSQPESIVFAKNQDFYVGRAGSNQFYRFNSAGVFQQAYTATIEDRGTDWVDLAADQKTIYYTSEGSSVLRFDTAANTQLANFASGLTGGAAYALRILSDGGVLVADTANVVRLDSSGNIVKTYDVAGEDSWFALNLDPDGKTFWSGDFNTGNFYRFDIATGTLITGPINTGTGASTLFGLMVYGEITQGGGGVGGAPLPPAVLLFGSGLLGLIGFRRFQK